MCYDYNEVKFMDQEQNLPPVPEEHYEPRPAWQVWGARIGLAAFIIFLILYYMNIFGGRS